MSITLTQARLLWWMAHVECPSWRPTRIVSDRGVTWSGSAHWGGMQWSKLCTHGLSAPRIVQKSVLALWRDGYVEVGAVEAKVVAHPALLKNATHAEKYAQAVARQRGDETLMPSRPKLVLTDKGKAAVPKSIPYPWVPHLNKLRDITRTEDERLAKVAALAPTASRRETV